MALPWLLAWSEAPSPTLYNQLLALGLWGVALMAMARGHGATTRPLAGRAQAAGALTLALLVPMFASLASGWWGHLPKGLALSGAATLAAATMVLAAGLRVGHALAGEAPAAQGRAFALHGFLAGMVLAGAVSAVIALLQVFAPGWVDGHWVARSALVGRAVGNVRQPNHLATLLLLAMVALVALQSKPQTSQPWAAQAQSPSGQTLALALSLAVGALLTVALTLSSSRTGVVGVVVLALWGLVDRRLAKTWRWGLAMAPLAYALTWWALAAWAHASGSTFAGEARLAANDLSSSRFAIWRDTLTLIGSHPWWGVGFGEFNLAWSMTPSPQRPLAFFDHTHNLPLHLAVELGVPLALTVCACLCVALWQAASRSRAHPAARACFVMVLLMAIHSQLEYPLWYAHFLLPTVFAWGVCLGLKPTPSTIVAPWGQLVTGAFGASMVCMATWAWADYQAVVAIYEDPPPASAATTKPLAERIEAGRQSRFFSHHADYAWATTAQPPGTALAAHASAKHYLLDARLMQAWATALSQSPDPLDGDRARHVAARLREFKNPLNRSFFEACDAPPAAASLTAFQCQAPSQPLDWRALR